MPKKFNWELLIQHVPSDKVFTPKSLVTSRDVIIKFNCEECNEVTERNFRSIVEKTGPLCATCTAKARQEKIKKTVNDRYGASSVATIPGLQEKKKETIKKLYGVDNISQLDSIKEKKKQTTLKNHGVENPSHSKEILQK
jgi:hypothetical protein